MIVQIVEKTEQLRHTKILVTGATSFIGRHLTEALILAGADVFSFSRRKSDDLGSDKTFVGDISDRETVLNIVDDIRPDFVFHLAASKLRTAEPADFRQCFNKNLIGTLNLVEACHVASKNSRIVTLGTCEEYGGTTPPYSEGMREAPVSAYSCSKLATTILLQTFHRVHGLPVVVLRPSLAYGPGQGDDMFLPVLIKRLLRKSRFAMSPGHQLRDFIFIDDLIEALLLASTNPESTGKVINISSGEPIKIKDLAKMVATIIGPDTYKLLDMGKISYRLGEAMKYCADNKIAKLVLGWQPKVSLIEGLGKTVEFYRVNLNEN
jgi:nucleoside-diphosphate-sugar epimerase